MKLEDKKTLSCHICKVQTEHALVFQDKKSGVEDDGPEGYESPGWTIYTEVFQCQGCKEVCIRRVVNHDLMDYPSEDFFPPRDSSPRGTFPELPTWAGHLPAGMHSLLWEVYRALGESCHRLAAMGFRALLEEVMNDIVGDIGGFEKKVEAMVTTGYLSPVQKKVLDPTIELGHAAIHRGHKPSESQLEAARSVVESAIHLLYVQKDVVKGLKAGVKPRRRQRASVSSVAS